MALSSAFGHVFDESHDGKAKDMPLEDGGARGTQRLLSRMWNHSYQVGLAVFKRNAEAPETAW